MMWGKHFKSMYEGSMVGAGACVFAVWGYVIANMLPDKDNGYAVSLNSRVIGAILGEAKESVDQAIQFLCSPDPESTSKDEQGKRLIQIAQFEYRVVNGQKYQSIRNAEDRKRQNREAQARYREKKKALSLGKFPKGPPPVPKHLEGDQPDFLNENPTQYGTDGAA